MRTYVDISEREVRTDASLRWHAESRWPNPANAMAQRLGPFAHRVETPQRLAHKNVYRVFFEVPDSPEGLLL